MKLSLPIELELGRCLVLASLSEVYFWRRCHRFFRKCCLRVFFEDFFALIGFYLGSWDIQSAIAIWVLCFVLFVKQKTILPAFIGMILVNIFSKILTILKIITAMFLVSSPLPPSFLTRLVCKYVRLLHFWLSHLYISLPHHWARKLLCSDRKCLWFKMESEAMFSYFRTLISWSNGCMGSHS